MSTFQRHYNNFTPSRFISSAHPCHMCNKRFSVVSNLRRHLKSCVSKFETLNAPHSGSREPSSNYLPAPPPTRGLESDDDDDDRHPSSESPHISPLAQNRRLTTSLDAGVIHRDHPIPASDRSYELDLSIYALYEPYASLQSADASSALGLAALSASSNIGHPSLSDPTLLMQSGPESNAAHVRPPTVSDAHQHRVGPDRNHPIKNRRWVPRSLRKCVNSSSLIPLPDNPRISTAAAPDSLSSSSSSQLSLDSSRRKKEEAAENARCAFIRSVPPQVVFWVQIPLPPVSPGWTSTMPPPSIPSFDVIHSEYAKLRHFHLEIDDTIHTMTPATNMSSNVHGQPITGSWAGQMDAHPATNAVPSHKPSLSSSSHSYSTTAVPYSRYDKPVPAMSPPVEKSPAPNRMPYFEERDSYYDPISGGGIAEQQLAARFPYHPAAWLGRLPGPGLSDAEQSMLRMRLLERQHV